MTLQDLADILASTGISTVYLGWPDNPPPPPLPWICYAQSGSDNFMADGTVYYQIPTVRIDLYTRRKSPATESILTNALSAANLPWNQVDEFINDELIHQTTYEVYI